MAAAVGLWAVAAGLAAVGAGRRVARACLVLGGIAVGAGCALTLCRPAAAVFELPGGLLGGAAALTPDAAWLMGLGTIPAALATALGSPALRWRAWTIGAFMSLSGAAGCFVVQDSVSFLVAWECMSLGGAVLLLSERLGPNHGGRPLLVMLGLLEVGAVALLAAIVIVSASARTTSWAFSGLPPGDAGAVGLLCLVGFGAKLGLLPFYEWYPRAYGQGSGASGAILSTLILNAAFFGLERAVLQWLPANESVGVVMLTVGVATAILAALYAFQEDDWRRLLAFSSAEHAAIAVTLVGAAQIFRANHLLPLASLALTVTLLHMGGHALAKGGMMLAADGVYRASGSYHIRPSGIMGRSRWWFGPGAVSCAMSLAAMPPTAGFVSEWYTFQTLFQGFHLSGLGARLALALAGAGMALTAALGLATFVKVIGIGLLGRQTAEPSSGSLSARHATAVFISGSLVLVLAVGMPWWLHALNGLAQQRWGMPDTAMQTGWLLIPLTDAFAFISPSKLVIAGPLLAIIPLVLLWRATRRHAVRRVAVWFGGAPVPMRGQTTALTFSNAMRTFYRFIYRPAASVRAAEGEDAYFTRHLLHHASVKPLFERLIVALPVRVVRAIARAVSPLQSGQMNVYLGMVGVLLVAIMIVAVL